MRNKIGDKERLKHIKDFCENIQRLIEGYDVDKFNDDFIISAAVCSYITWIGEAVTHLSNEIKDKRPDINWRKIKDMRNFITHEYFGIDYKTIYNVAKENKPPFKIAIEQILKNFE